jgi:FK506-binding nuclear protein
MLQWFGFGYQKKKMKKKTTKLQKSTQASLVDATTKDTSRTSICVDIENTSFTLCTLIPNKVEQQLLDIYFVEGEAVTFVTNGQHPIYLMGNYVFPDIEPTLDITKTILK